MTRFHYVTDLRKKSQDSMFQDDNIVEAMLLNLELNPKFV